MKLTKEEERALKYADRLTSKTTMFQLLIGGIN